jgi:Delta7-sterol 5-desaturase
MEMHMDIADLTTYAQQWLENLSTDLSRYVVFAIGVWLLLWVLLAQPLAARKIRPKRPDARQLLLEFAFSVRSIAIFSTVGLAMFVLGRLGYLPGPGVAVGWGKGWAVVSLILMIVAHDAYFYWTHRAIHDARLFRLFHLRHHRSHNPSPFSAYSFDFTEASLQAAFVPIWMLLVPTQWPIVGLFMMHQIARNTIGHSGYEIFPAGRDGRPMLDFLTTTTHHDLHHAVSRWNYGLYFTWWDRWMCTEHPDYYARFASVARPSSRSARKSAAPTALLLAVLFAGCALASRARAKPGAEIDGEWATQGLGGVVRLEPCASNKELLCGRLIWVWDPEAVRPGSIGSLMLQDFAWDRGAWRGGRLLNPQDGRTYSGEVRPEGDLLRLKGCAALVFCQSQVWRRLSSIPRM